MNSFRGLATEAPAGWPALSERPPDTPVLLELDLTTGELVVGLGGVRHLIATGITGPQHFYVVIGFDMLGCDSVELLGAAYNVVEPAAGGVAAAGGGTCADGGATT